MKFLTLLLAFLITSTFAQTPPPVSIKGQHSASKLLPKWNLQVPNNQATNLGGIDALIETGNNNLLENPSFEHSTFNTGWTCTGITPTVETTIVAPGSKKSMKLAASATTFECYQDSTIGAAYASSVQFLAMMRVKSSFTGTLKVCTRSAGVTSTSLCTSNIDDTFNFRKIPFTGSTTSNGIAIVGTSVTGNIYLDDGFVGAVDLKQDVDQSRIAGESYIAGTSSCSWTRTSTTIGAFTSTAACPGPTIVDGSMGSWQTTDSDLPRQTVNNLPAGKYKATFIFETVGGANGISTSVAINDGTTTCQAVTAQGDADNTGNVVVSCVFTYAQAGDRVFEVYGASSSSTLNILNTRTTPPSAIKFTLEYFGSTSTYSSTNADTDWASCGHTTSDFTGFGTVTGIETQCKRQGSDLLMKGKFTSGTSTAVEARVNLKLNSTTLTSKNTSVIPTIQKVGTWVRSIVGEPIGTVLIEPSVQYLTWSVTGNGTLAPLSKGNGSAIISNTNIVSFDARIPIAGWENSNVIIGQFNGLESCSSTLACTDSFSAKVSSTGVVSQENVDWINGSCTNANPRVCTYNTSLFTATPNCTATPVVFGSVTAAFSAQSSSSISVYTSNDTGAGSQQAFNISCQKAAPDYIGKTAKAVASDQNIATPGVTKVKACYYAFGGASATLASPIDCTTGTCVEVVDSCGAITPPAFSSTGFYINLTIANGTFANSSYIDCKCVSFNTGAGNVNQCNPYFDTSDQSWSSTSNGGAVLNFRSTTADGVARDGYTTVKCEGVAP